MKFFAILWLLCASAATAQRLPDALVWLPPENFLLWNEVDDLLRAHDDVKLTIGLTPAMATSSSKAVLMPWVEKGRIEIAARINGDPVLTIIAGHPVAPRPQDPLERAVEAREELQTRLGVAPAGFIPGAGAADSAVAAALAASGASWILAGPYAAPDAPWAASGGAVIVPSSAANFYDESASTASVFLAAAAMLPRPAQGWTTVSILAHAKSEAAVELPSDASFTSWDPQADAKGSWDAYGAAARTLNRYQNSGSADLRTLDAAVDLLRRAQAARFYRAPDDGVPSPELRAALLAVYKKLNLPAPEALYGASSAAASAASADERPTGVRALSGPSWFEFRAPLGTIALSPFLSSGTAAAASSSTAGARGAVSPHGQVVDGGSSADSWRIRSLRAEWDETSVNLILRVGGVTDSAPRPIYEVYMDFNHVLGAGRVPLLEGRGAVVPARDAWELALSIVGDEARLYRARGGGEPEETAVFKAQRRADLGEVGVTVPRSYMRGNPARWGWAVVALAEDPARPDRRPASALIGPGGTILLGALAPADLQKSILSRANARVPAARIER